jgi:hypothetical protein
MLLDFPSIKKSLMEDHKRKIQGDIDAKMPLASQIKVVPMHEGDGFSFERSDGVIESQKFSAIEKPIAVAARLEFADTVESLKEKTDELTTEVASEIERMLFDSVTRVTTEVGNSLDMKGRPFTAEAYLESLEMLDIDFDFFGMPQMPSQVAHPAMIATITAELERFKTSSTLRERYASILEKKCEEWRDRESRRRLVT